MFEISYNSKGSVNICEKILYISRCVMCYSVHSPSGLFSEAFTYKYYANFFNLNYSFLYLVCTSKLLFEVSLFQQI